MMALCPYFSLSLDWLRVMAKCVLRYNVPCYSADLRTRDIFLSAISGAVAGALSMAIGEVTLCARAGRARFLIFGVFFLVSCY